LILAAFRRRRARSLAEGWRQLRGCLKPAAGFAAVFVLIGVLIFALLLCSTLPR
jgi:hypothetical protein